MHHFDPTDYGNTFETLLSQSELSSLDQGTPNYSIKTKLDELSVDNAFSTASIQNLSMAQCCIAGIWLYHGFLDESHQISQSIATPTGSYWHGLMHRREPDYSNSKYWFRRVGNHPVFTSLLESIPAMTPQMEIIEFKTLLTKTTWDPFTFIDYCEISCQQPSPLKELCKRIQQIEYHLLFDYCFHQTIQSD
ncbi:MAG: hypothetical protein VX435_02890 [Planctomycetota bacterium]|mgnify:FL=1|jgi:hypothetical protein|nr:hypothetical protein [Planctomycetota bacterium]